MLYDEIETRVGWADIWSRNKSISKDMWDFSSTFRDQKIKYRKEKKQEKEVNSVILRYVSYLKKIWDPRVEKITDILELDVDEDVLDNEVEQVKDLTRRSASLLYDKTHWEVIQGATWWLPYDMGLALFNSVEKFSRKAAFEKIHVRSSAILQIATLTSSWVTAVLMFWHNATNWSREFVEKMYEALSVNIWDLQIDWNHTLAFMILAPFFAEMWHKISQQWWKYFTANWSWEVPMNWLWLAEVYMRVQDILWNSQLDAGTASLFRIARILRGYHQATNQIPVFRKNTRLISKALPAIAGMMANVTVALSATTLVMMELMWQEEWPYSTVWWTIQELARLVTTEWFEDTFQNIMNNDWNTSAPIVIAIILMVMMKFVIEPIITAGASAVMGEDKKTEQYLASMQEQNIKIQDQLSFALEEITKLQEGCLNSEVKLQLEELVHEISSVTEQQEGSQQDFSELLWKAKVLLSMINSKPS